MVGYSLQGTRAPRSGAWRVPGAGNVHAKSACIANVAPLQIAHSTAMRVSMQLSAPSEPWASPLLRCGIGQGAMGGLGRGHEAEACGVHVVFCLLQHSGPSLWIFSGANALETASVAVSAVLRLSSEQQRHARESKRQKACPQNLRKLTSAGMRQGFALARQRRAQRAASCCGPPQHR